MMGRMTGQVDPRTEPRSQPGDAELAWGDESDPETSADVPPLSDRLTRLARVTRELVSTDTLDSVAKTIVTHGAEAVGAALATMTLLSDDGQTVRLAALSGGLPGDEDAWGTFSITENTPSAEAIRTGGRLILSDAGALPERYPRPPMTARGACGVGAPPFYIRTRR